MIRRLSVDALYDAIRDYTAATGAQPTLLHANHAELRDAIRHMTAYEWALGLEAGVLLGMRLDLTASPGEWHVGSTP